MVTKLGGNITVFHFFYFCLNWTILFEPQSYWQYKATVLNFFVTSILRNEKGSQEMKCWWWEQGHYVQIVTWFSVSKITAKWSCRTVWQQALPGNKLQPPYLLKNSAQHLAISDLRIFKMSLTGVVNILEKFAESDIKFWKTHNYTFKNTFTVIWENFDRLIWQETFQTEINYMIFHANNE